MPKYQNYVYKYLNIKPALFRATISISIENWLHISYPCVALYLKIYEIGSETKFMFAAILLN